MKLKGLYVGVIHVIIGSLLILFGVGGFFKLAYSFVLFAIYGIPFTFFGFLFIYSHQGSITKKKKKLQHLCYLWSIISAFLGISMSVLVAILLNLKFLDLHYCLEFMETCIGMLVGVGVSMTIISVVGICVPESKVESNYALLNEDVIAFPPLPSNVPPDHNRRAVIKFNNVSPQEAIQYLIDNGLMNGTALEVGKFLYSQDNLNLVKLGEYLGDGEKGTFNHEILKAYVNCFNFETLKFAEALRKFLTKFRLPGEAQKIDRIIEQFAYHYVACNPKVFPNPDTAYVLAFSLIMLNTDAHNPSVKKKMSVEAFIHNNRGIADGKDLEESFLKDLYDNITQNEIKMDNPAFANSVKEGWLKKLGGNGRWQKRWFVVSNNCLFYFDSPDDTRPKVLIPLEGLSIEECESESPDLWAFDLIDPQRNKIKSCKLGPEAREGKHEKFTFAAKSPEERRSWMASIIHNIVANPIMGLINKKKEIMAKNKKQETSSHRRTISMPTNPLLPNTTNNNTKDNVNSNVAEIKLENKSEQKENLKH